MSTTLDDRTARDQARWLAWIEKGKRRDRAAAVKYKWAGAICAGLLTLAAIYFGAIR
jgi:hypothetical protein